jgi:hypothetical protein
MNYDNQGMGAETPLRVEVTGTGDRGLLVGGGIPSSRMLSQLRFVGLVHRHEPKNYNYAKTH